MSEVFRMIAAERRQVADLFDTLNDEQWSTPSLCSDWTVRHVAAHLAMPFSVSMPKLLVKMASRRFDFNRVSDEWAKAEPRSNEELVQFLRDNAEHRFTPPGGGPEFPLTDIMVHGQDVRRPLGIAHTFDPTHTRTVLELLMSKKATRGFVPKGAVDGLRFVADDIDWSHGDGPTVTGTGEALMLALGGRRVAFDDLTGEGCATFRTRFKL